MDVDSVSGGGTGSARRRRERRLRQFLRHERLSVAMALSEKKHHTSSGQRKDRAGGEARDALHGHVPEAPLPQGRVLRHVVGHLQGFSSGQRSTASPSSKKRISERIVEQIVDPVSSGRLQGSSSSHSPAGDEERADEPGKAVFRTFPQNTKSAKLGSHSGSELLPESSSSMRAAQLEDSVEWVRLRDVNSGKPYFWNRRTRASAWNPPPDVKVVWFGERNEEGLVWYWHRDTRVSTFDLPPLPPG